NNKVISELSITSADSPAGLFGKIGTGGIVQNLKLTGGHIKGVTSDCGSIAGVNGGTIQNSIVSAAVSGDISQNTGGIVGKNDSGGKVEKCTVATGSSITGAKGKTGVLAGENNGDMDSNTVYRGVKINGAPAGENNLVGTGKAPTNTNITNPQGFGGGGSGCDTGFGFAALAALAGTRLIRRRERQ
ncbi:MAG: hypothetical protein LBB28_04515, partial [Synergistaceae bacterium]|nr:hypothetical protein [Synergistaceae bacterium]